MKKRFIWIGVLAAIAVVLSIWLFIRPRVLGNINHACSEPETNISKISFSGEAGERIKFSFVSDIEMGELNIRVRDSKGNVTKELDRAKRLETYLELSHADTYTVETDYKDFIGSFKVKIYNMD